MASSIYDSIPPEFQTTRGYFFSKEAITKAMNERDRLNDRLNGVQNLDEDEARVEVLLGGEWQIKDPSGQ